MKQDGAILGDSVRSFVDRCFRSGRNNYTGSDLHSWYAAYCKAHNLSPQGYNKFVHHLQRVLAKHWRASEVVREGDKIKRIPAQWRGLQILPCFVDVAIAEDEDGSNRPHIPNWACIKTTCADGGLQELAETRTVTSLSEIAQIPAHSQIAQTLAVTDVTSLSEIVTISENATTHMVTDVTALHDKSSQSEKTPSPDIAENVNSTVPSQPVTDVTPVTAPVTPTFEPSAKPCNNSKTCNKPRLTPEPSPSAPRVNWFAGDRVKVSAQYPGAEEYRGELATIVEVYSDGLCRIELDREISVFGGKPKKQFNLDGDYLEPAVANSNLKEDELKLAERALQAIADKNPANANDVYCQVHELGVKEAVKAALTDIENEAFRQLVKLWKKNKSQP